MRTRTGDHDSPAGMKASVCYNSWASFRTEGHSDRHRFFSAMALSLSLSKALGKPFDLSFPANKMGFITYPSKDAC